MKTINILNSVLKALDEELRAVDSDYPKSFGLYKGHPVGEFDGSNVYSFTAPPVTVADGTSVTLEVGDPNFGGRFDPACIVGYEGINVIISSVDNPGLAAERVALRHEDGLMLMELRERLTEIKKAKSTNSELLEKLFTTPDAGTAATGPGADDTETTVVNAALSQEVSLVWTPPGTNQDGVIATCAQRHAAQGNSVLVLTPATPQSDVISLLLVAGPTAASITRVGSPMPGALPPLEGLSPSSIARRRDPQLFRDLDRVTREELEREKRRLEERSQKAEQAAIDSASIVLSTLGRAVSHEWVYGRPYDVVIIGGAHRALLAQVVWAMLLAEKAVIFAGDFRQAPNSVTSRSDESAQWLKRNIFEAAGVVDVVNAGGWDSRLLMLRTQHTMHPLIARIAKEVSYGGRLLDAPEVVQRTAVITAQPPEPGQAVVFYDIGHLLPHAHAADSGGSRSNVLMAALTMSVVSMLQSKATLSILLATLYGDQWRIHRAFIRDADLQDYVTTTTLHRCIHPQHDVLILDLVDSSPLPRVGPPLKGGWGSEAMHQLNAAFTSPRGKIVMIGNWGLLQQTLPEDAAMRRFLDEMMRGGAVIKPFPLRYLTPEVSPKNVTFFNDSAQAWPVIYHDIAAASNRVVWNWPYANADEVFAPHNLTRMFAAKAKRALALAVDNPARHPLVGHGLKVARSIRGEAGVQIDDNIFWLIGNGASAGASRPFIRVNGERAALQISDLFGLNEIIPSAKSRPWVTRKPRAQREGVRS